MQIAEKLRAVTRSIHLQLHEHPLLKILTSPDISAEDLVYIQKAQYGFWQPLQNVEHTSMPTSPIVQWLKEDLKASGVNHLKLNLCQVVPPLTNEEQILGLTYVKEGALLGGQFIFKNISQSLPERVHALRFFQGRGKETGLHWREFLHYLELQSQQLDHDVICQSALTTFIHFKQWMDYCYDERHMI